MRRMLKVTIRFRGNDKYEGKPLLEELLTFLRESKVSGATVYRGIYGYGVRGVASAKVLALSLDLPLVVEVVDEHDRLERLLERIKQIVNDNGLITIEDVYTI